MGTNESLWVSVGVNEREVRRRFASERGRVFLTLGGYFWICFLFGLHEKRQTSCICAVSGRDANLDFRVVIKEFNL